MAVCLVLASALSLAGARAEAPADPASTLRVVVLYADAVGLPTSSQVDEALRQELSRTFGERLDYSSDFLDLMHAAAPDYEETLKLLLQAKHAHRPPDVVIVMGSTALRFVVANRQDLFPGVPIVFCHVEPRELSALALPPDVVPVA